MARKFVSSPLFSAGNTVLKSLKFKFAPVGQSWGRFIIRGPVSPGKLNKFLLETPEISWDFIFQKWCQPSLGN